jgi:predicted RNase H-like HicB family nuclease
VNRRELLRRLLVRKPYQIRQFLKLVEQYDLPLEDLGAMKDYHINVFWSEDDESYIADIPDLVACSAFGSTPQEAVEEVLAAKEAWIESARAHGKPIPEPTYRAVIYQAAR